MSQLDRPSVAIFDNVPGLGEGQGIGFAGQFWNRRYFWLWERLFPYKIVGQNISDSDHIIILGML